MLWRGQQRRAALTCWPLVTRIYLATPSGGQMKPAICQLWICNQPLHEKVKKKKGGEKKNQTHKRKKSQRKDRERTALAVLQIFISPKNNRGRQSSMLPTVLACFKSNVIPWRCPALPSAKSSNLISREQHIFMCSSLPEARGLMVASGSKTETTSPLLNDEFFSGGNAEQFLHKHAFTEKQF